MNRTFVSLGCGFAFLAVALGAFGKHALEKQVSAASLEVWQTAAHYHLIHAVALIVTGILAAHSDQKSVRTSGWLFTAGIVIFSGTLYAYAVTGIKAFAIVTPLGGLCFMAAWLLLCITFAKKNPA